MFANNLTYINALPILVIQDISGNLAVPTTNYVQGLSGLLLPAPLDLNNNPVFSMAPMVGMAWPIR